MIKTAKAITIISLALLTMAGCAATNGTIKSVMTTKAMSAYKTAAHDDLIALPKPKEPIYVAVYKFRDQTGQYKPNDTATSFSTAVTQGATSMIYKALEDSRWFIPVEREGLSNLLSERKIINSTRAYYKAQTGKELDPMPALLYAPIIIEGGIISYETNLVTGGIGVKYFGVSGSTMTRRDQVTIYLRAVSVKTGKVIKSISTHKAILSRQVDFGFFRFIRFKTLLEAEAGMTYNEPPQMCVLEAIEKAVYDLIMDGILDGTWQLKNPADIHSPAVQNYIKEQHMEKEVSFDDQGNIVEVKHD